MTDNSTPAVEPFVTLGEAAEHLGLPKWKVSRAAKAGAFPTYRIGNGRALVRVSEVVAAINASRTGGAK